MKLSDREWKLCRLSKLGKVESGRDIYAMERVEGDIPYITSGSQNNGIGYFVSNKNDTLDKGYIALNRNGAVGLAFYHPYWSVMGNDCRKIHISKADENLYVGLFISTAISMQSKSFSYSRKLGTARANKLQVILPVDDNDEPDYQFMEDYMKELMLAKRKQYQEYVEQRLAELGIDDVKNTKVEGYNLDLESREWCSFKIIDIFKLIRGSEGNMASLNEGNVPLISARNIGNGLKGFVDNPKKIIKGKCITLNNDGDGGAGLAYYQPCDMALDTHVTALTPISKMSPDSMLMISECLSKLHGFFGHGHSISNKRATNLKTMLPVNDNGEPDYEFMEECGRKIMAKKYKQYLAFLEKMMVAKT